MKLSRKRITRIRKMRHQTRKNNKKRFKRRRKRRRRSFRKNKLDMSNRTLRMTGGVNSIHQRGGSLFSISAIHPKAKNIMRLPIIHLEQLLDRPSRRSL